MPKENLTFLFERQAEQIKSSADNWQSFLSTAGQNYKYSFSNQVMIYAQNPKATACAGIKMWNKIGWRIKRGSKSIRLIEEKNDDIHLKYIFDISDAYSQNGKKIRLWELPHKDMLKITANI